MDQLTFETLGVLFVGTSILRELERLVRAILPQDEPEQVLDVLNSFVFDRAPDRNPTRAGSIHPALLGAVNELALGEFGEGPSLFAKIVPGDNGIEWSRASDYNRQDQAVCVYTNVNPFFAASATRNPLKFLRNGEQAKILEPIAVLPPFSLKRKDWRPPNSAPNEGTGKEEEEEEEKAPTPPPRRWYAAATRSRGRSQPIPPSPFARNTRRPPSRHIYQWLGQLVLMCRPGKLIEDQILTWILNKLRIAFEGIEVFFSLTKPSIKRQRDSPNDASVLDYALHSETLDCIDQLGTSLYGIAVKTSSAGTATASEIKDILSRIIRDAGAQFQASGCDATGVFNTKEEALAQIFTKGKFAADRFAAKAIPLNSVVSRPLVHAAVKDIVGTRGCISVEGPEVLINALPEELPHAVYLARKRLEQMAWISPSTPPPYDVTNSSTQVKLYLLATFFQGCVKAKAAQRAERSNNTAHRANMAIDAVLRQVCEHAGVDMSILSRHENDFLHRARENSPMDETDEEIETRQTVNMLLQHIQQPQDPPSTPPRTTPRGTPDHEEAQNNLPSQTAGKVTNNNNFTILPRKKEESNSNSIIILPSKVENDTSTSSIVIFNTKDNNTSTSSNTKVKRSQPTSTSQPFFRPLCIRNIVTMPGPEGTEKSIIKLNHGQTLTLSHPQNHSFDDKFLHSLISQGLESTLSPDRKKPRQTFTSTSTVQETSPPPPPLLLTNGHNTQGDYNGTGEGKLHSPCESSR